MPLLSVMQDEASSRMKITCRVTTTSSPQQLLIPGQWVDVAECDPGPHNMQIQTVLGSGRQGVTLSLKGGTFHEKDEIVDRFKAPRSGADYDIEVKS